MSDGKAADNVDRVVLPAPFGPIRRKSDPPRFAETVNPAPAARQNPLLCFPVLTCCLLVNLSSSAL